MIALSRGDLPRADLWNRRDTPPDVRRWAISVIGLLDPALAVRLYWLELARGVSQWDELGLHGLMLQLGDRGSATAMVALLSDIDPAKLRPAGKETSAEATFLRAVELLVRQDDRRVLPSVQAAARVYDSEIGREYVAVWVAQLERDVARLERMARSGHQTGVAVDSLARIGAVDVLQRLTTDSNRLVSSDAKHRLMKPLPPTPPPLNPSSPCRALDSMARREIADWLNDRFPRLDVPGVDCGTRSASSLKGRRDAALCIEDLYWRGLTASGLWARPDRDPFPGADLLDYLGEIDPVRAAALWAERRNAPGRNPWAKTHADLRRVQLGDRGGIGGLIEFLQAPPNLAPGEERWQRSMIEEAAAQLVRIDYRPARALLVSWRDRGLLQSEWFAVGLARLSRDIVELERLARTSPRVDEAIDALGDLGATSTLTRLSRDPSFPNRFVAQRRLAKGSNLKN